MSSSRVIVVGDSGVGKESLIEAMISESRESKSSYITGSSYIRRTKKIEVATASSDAKPKAPIHYIVIGPLQSTAALSHIIQMKKCVDNPITLACLARNAGGYRGALRDTKVEVKTVESYLEEGSEVKQFTEIANKVRRIQAIVLENPARNKVIDRVAFKELIAFYLLALKGGFTMDANVHPTADEKKGNDSQKLELPEEKQFCYPWYLTPELWMFYAPPNNKAAFDILTTYLDNWDSAQGALAHWVGETNYPYRYHLAVTHLSLDAIQVVARSSGLRELPAWQFIFTGSTTVNLKGINIEKTYGNSHKHPEHLAERVEASCRYIADNKDCRESEFNLEALNEISENFKKQLIDDINCCLVFFNKKFTASTAFSPLTQLRRLLAQENVTYAELMVEVIKLTKISAEETKLLLRAAVNPQKLWVKNMAKRLEKNFKARTAAMQVMQPVIAIDALKSLNKISIMDDFSSGLVAMLPNGMKYKVIHSGFYSVYIYNPDGVCIKDHRFIISDIEYVGMVDIAVLPNGYLALSMVTGSSVCDIGHVSIIDPINFNLTRDFYDTMRSSSTKNSPGKKYVAVLPDGNIAVSGGMNAVIQIYKYSTPKLHLIDQINVNDVIASKEELLEELKKLLIEPEKLELSQAAAPSDRRARGL